MLTGIEPLRGLSELPTLTEISELCDDIEFKGNDRCIQKTIL